METSKMSAKGALDGSVTSHQRLHHREGAAYDAPTVSGHSDDSVRPLGSSLSIAYRQLPCYPGQRIGNDDLLTTINSHGQSLAECISLVESTLTVARC